MLDLCKHSVTFAFNIIATVASSLSVTGSQPFAVRLLWKWCFCFSLDAFFPGPAATKNVRPFSRSCNHGQNASEYFVYNCSTPTFQWYSLSILSYRIVGGNHCLYPSPPFYWWSWIWFSKRCCSKTRFKGEMQRIYIHPLSPSSVEVQPLGELFLVSVMYWLITEVFLKLHSFSDSWILKLL